MLEQMVTTMVTTMITWGVWALAIFIVGFIAIYILFHAVGFFFGLLMDISGLIWAFIVVGIVWAVVAIL